MKLRMLLKIQELKTAYVTCTFLIQQLAITINEGADISVKKDIITALKKIAPYGAEYLHMEGNADSHIKTTLVGSSVSVFIEEEKLILGQWQSIFFCEFDGPRARKIYLKIIKEEA